MDKLPSWISSAMASFGFGVYIRITLLNSLSFVYCWGILLDHIFPDDAEVDSLMFKHYELNVVNTGSRVVISSESWLLGNILHFLLEVIIALFGQMCHMKERYISLLLPTDFHLYHFFCLTRSLWVYTTQPNSHSKCNSGKRKDRSFIISSLIVNTLRVTLLCIVR